MCGKALPFRSRRYLVSARLRLAYLGVASAKFKRVVSESRRLSAHQAAKPQTGPMTQSLHEIVNSYNADAPLVEASTIPSSWYTDQRIFELEKETVFTKSWQVAARIDQLIKSGDYVTTEIGDEPIVIVRGNDNQLRGFFNVCRHHAAAVMIEREGHANQMRCPYHGWTYSLEGGLKGTPDFNEVCSFDRAENGLIPIQIAVWKKWVFARLRGQVRPLNESDAELAEFIGAELIEQFGNLDVESLHWFQRRSYRLNCNGKVFVDNCP